MTFETKYYGTGRRKSSVARVFVTPGKGIIMVIIDPSKIIFVGTA